MNFLAKIEEAINRFLENLLVKLKAATPAFFTSAIFFLAHLPLHAKKKGQNHAAKLRIMGLKFVGYSEHYTTIVRGQFTGLMIYLRSDAFKKSNKKDLLLIPLKYVKFHPVKTLMVLCTAGVLAASFTVIFKNTEKIIAGTKALRKPASMESAEEDLFIEFKKHKFEVKFGASAGGHGGGGEEHEYTLYLDIKIEARNEKEKAFLEDMEEMLEDNIEALELPVSQLPLDSENLKKIEEMMASSLNADFRQIGQNSPIKSIKLKQVLPGRPQYYRQGERMFSVSDINLQIFLEDTHRNRQVWLDFSVLASNRNVVLYLKNHEVELKDHLSTNVEPVIPQLPVEDEGRLIIKDKIRSEINQFLEKNEIEGKILEIYIDYLMVS
ncbi:MAG: hypothetical protein ACXVLQ_17410 [Bacteriovorax sp.]